jgi:hypothetical protein
MGELAALAELRAMHRDDPLVALLVQAAILHTRARLQVTEIADEQAARLSQAADAQRERAPTGSADEEDRASR